MPKKTFNDYSPNDTIPGIRSGMHLKNARGMHSAMEGQHFGKEATKAIIQNTKSKITLNDILDLPSIAMKKLHQEIKINRGDNALQTTVKVAQKLWKLPRATAYEAVELYKKKHTNTSKNKKSQKAFASMLLKLATAAGVTLGGVKVMNAMENQPHETEKSKTLHEEVKQVSGGISQKVASVIQPKQIHHERTEKKSDEVLEVKSNIDPYPFLSADNTNVTKYMGDIHFDKNKIKELLLKHQFLKKMCIENNESFIERVNSIYNNWDDFENHVNVLAIDLNINAMSIYTLIFGESVFHPGAEELNPRGANIKGYGYIQFTGKPNIRILTRGRDINKLSKTERMQVYGNDNQFRAIKEYLGYHSRGQYPWDLKVNVHHGYGHAKKLLEISNRQKAEAELEISKKSQKHDITYTQKDQILRNHLGEQYADFIAFPAHWDELKSCIDRSRTNLFFSTVVSSK